MNAFRGSFKEPLNEESVSSLRVFPLGGSGTPAKLGVLGHKKSMCPRTQRSMILSPPPREVCAPASPGLSPPRLAFL